MTEQFWKPKPRDPWHDWRTYSLLIPCLVSAAGAFVFMALAFSFTELDTLPQAFRTNLVIVGAFAVAFGSTFGSVFSGLEIYRKVFAFSVIAWDWVSLILSVLTTVGGFAMGFAALLGATSNWTTTMQAYGPLALGVLVALDSVGDIIEFGGLFGSYESRYEQWETEYEQWQETSGQRAVQIDQALISRLDSLIKDVGGLTEWVANLETRWSWPMATRADIERIVAGLNGDQADLTRTELGLILAEHHLNLPSRATIRRGLTGG